MWAVVCVCSQEVESLQQRQQAEAQWQQPSSSSQAPGGEGGGRAPHASSGGGLQARSYVVDHLQRLCDLCDQALSP